MAEPEWFVRKTLEEPPGDTLRGRRTNRAIAQVLDNPLRGTVTHPRRSFMLWVILPVSLLAVFMLLILTVRIGAL